MEFQDSCFFIPHIAVTPSGLPEHTADQLTTDILNFRTYQTPLSLTPSSSGTGHSIYSSPVNYRGPERFTSSPPTPYESGQIIPFDNTSGLLADETFFSSFCTPDQVSSFPPEPCPPFRNETVHMTEHFVETSKPPPSNADNELMLHVEAVLKKRNINPPNELLCAFQISQNPRFLVCRDSMILNWLRENHRDIFISIPPKLLSYKEWKIAQKQDRSNEFVHCLWKLALDCSTRE